MAGTTVSFVADPRLAARVKEIARSDGVTQSQAAARASALGAVLAPAARRTLRLVLEEGGEEAYRDLAAVMAKAIAQVGNTMLERQLLARAHALGSPSDTDTDRSIEEEAVSAVSAYRRENGSRTHPAAGRNPGPSGRR